jgi:uncharacterized DUF497 family protein
MVRWSRTQDAAVNEFEWDDDNVEHVEEHGVAPEEVEEALADPDRVAVPAYNTPRERRRGVVGATEDGRILLVIYTRRASRIRVVTARDAEPPYRRRYRRR